MRRKNILIGWLRLLVLSFICIFPSPGYTQAPISGTINEYTPVTGIDSCTNSVTVGNPAGFNPGDRVLIIQMKGATIDQTNTVTFGDIIDYGSAGKYEFANIASVSGGNISFVQALLHWYDITGAVQLVRVPQYGNVTVSGTLTCPAWNGATGGVLVFEVSGTLTLNADMDVSGKGFRHGASSSRSSNGCHIYDFVVPISSGNGAYKGEGIVNYNRDANGGKGKLANGGGGGNRHNGGGAGGGNYGAGGAGGYGWPGCTNIQGVGGIGGAALNYSQQRLFLGGGGGGGQQNDEVLSPGGNGGGLILLRAGTIIAASGIAIKADGLASADMTGSSSDGVGGGGAGGIISISAQTITGSSIAVSARGGKGGDNAAGGGDAAGGGGGGLIWLSSSSLQSAISTTVTGGAAGYNRQLNSNNGTGPGQPGQVMTGLVLQESANSWIPIYTLSISPDTVICVGDTATLQVIGNYTGAVFRWNTGDTTPVIRTSAAGTYWLEMNANSNYYCPLSDTVTVGLVYPPVPDLGPDRGVCDKDLPVILSAPQLAGTTYLWSDGQTGGQMLVRNSGTFWVELTHMGCRLSDTIDITIVPTPVVYVGPDTTICEQHPLTLSTGNIPGAAYLWSTGATTPSVRVNTTGTYVLTVDLEGCIVHDTVRVTAMPPPDVDLGEDRDICPEQEIILSDRNNNGDHYLWSTGDTTAAITVRTGGMYSLGIVTEYGCAGNDTVLLSYYPKPEVFIGSDTTVCEETPLLLTPQAFNADSLIWSDGSSGANLLVNYGGDYVVTAVNMCGSASDTITLNQIFCDIWIPNAFTPNGDGLNDLFRVLGNIGRLNGFVFSIFNRWGERVYTTQNKLQGWDGTYKGVPAQFGTYVYLLQYNVDNRQYIRKGNFQLLR